LEIREEIWGLLMEHNCVIVPNFGAFVGNYKSAQINNLNHKIYPPSKQVTFNPKLTHNDGELFSFIALKFGYNYAEAEQVCKKQIDILKQNLQQGKVLEFFKVGKVFKDSLGNTRFEPSKKYNLLADAFGLEEVIAFPHKFKIEEPVKAPIPQSEEKTIVAKPEKNTIAPILSIDFNKRSLTAAAAVLIFILYSFYLSFQTNLIRGGNFHMSELNPFSSKVCEVYSPRNMVNPSVVVPKESLNIIPDSLNYISFSLFNEDEDFLKGDDKIVSLRKTPKTKVDSTKVVLNKPKSNKVLPYQILVGCFADKANAENLVISLRNEGYLNAELVDYWRGLYRVRIDAFENKDEALAKLPAIKQNKSPGAWIIRK
jgi:hypothetical protein